jgi:hypothetical protein
MLLDPYDTRQGNRQLADPLPSKHLPRAALIDPLIALEWQRRLAETHPRAGGSGQLGRDAQKRPGSHERLASRPS